MVSGWGSTTETREPKEGPQIGLSRLCDYPIVYIATPYSKYPYGQDAAFQHACRITASLLKEGVKAYSPIAHTHPVALYGGLDLFDHKFWLPYDQAMMDASGALVVVTFPSWEISYGISEEIKIFKAAAKPVLYLDPLSMALSEAP